MFIFYEMHKYTFIIIKIKLKHFYFTNFLIESKPHLMPYNLCLVLYIKL